MIINGDCIEEMQKLIDDGVQVDSVVTDPPYHLQSIVDRFGKASVDDDNYTSEKVRNGVDSYSRLIRTGFMGKEWDGGDIAFRKETWELALKLLKPGGHLLAFSASRNYHRMAVAIEDAGFEIRDQIMWIYGSGFPKSHNIGKGIDKKQGNQRKVIGTKGLNSYKTKEQHEAYGNLRADFDKVNELTEPFSEEAKQWEGWGTALKPAHEPIVMARKPLSEKSIVDNVLKHSTGGINIDGCRIEYISDYDKKHQADIARGQENADNGVFFGGKGKTKASTHEPTGRFPANVMHDGSEEVLSGFPNTKSTKGNPRTASIKNQTRLNNSEEVFVNCEYDDEGSAARFFYCPKVSRSERGKDNTHPTVKPQELMKYLCRLVTPKGGTVLDPFMGSGSTGMAAKDEGFEFIGIERENEYFEIAAKRIEKTAPLTEFFS